VRGRLTLAAAVALLVSGTVLVVVAFSDGSHKTRSNASHVRGPVPSGALPPPSRSAGTQAASGTQPGAAPNGSPGFVVAPPGSSKHGTPPSSRPVGLVERRAERSLKRSTSLRGLLGTASYKIADVGPWMTTDGRVRLGTAFDLRLRRTRAISGLWPSAHLNPGSSGVGQRYVSQLKHFAARKVSDLLVEISTSGVVVNVEPMNGA
jgi:hypothetical protein